MYILFYTYKTVLFFTISCPCRESTKIEKIKVICNCLKILLRRLEKFSTQYSELKLTDVIVERWWMDYWAAPRIFSQPYSSVDR